MVNKPAGLAVHGGSGLHFGVIEAMRQLRPDCPQMELVHRLDRDTSGCLVIAKKRAALKVCHAALRDKTANKTYTALAAGSWPVGLDVINAPLKKNTLQSGERMVMAAADGTGEQPPGQSWAGPAEGDRRQLRANTGARGSRGQGQSGTGPAEGNRRQLRASTRARGSRGGVGQGASHTVARTQ